MMKSEQLLNLNNEIKFKKKVYNANEQKKSRSINLMKMPRHAMIKMK